MPGHWKYPVQEERTLTSAPPGEEALHLAKAGDSFGWQDKWVKQVQQETLPHLVKKKKKKSNHIGLTETGD